MAKSIDRDELVRYLDDYLRVADIPDASPNGLQFEGAASVGELALAVDAGVQTIEAAAESGAQMLVVHHGLWWGRHEQVVGTMRRRIGALVAADLSLYAAHLPLDCHPEVGNNVELARLLGFEPERPFGDYKGTEIGVIAAAPSPVRREELAVRMRTVLGTSPDVLAFGPERVRRLAVVTGAGAMFAEAARREGCDALVTGESSHAAYHPAKEAGINLVYGGHYATETVGLHALARHIESRFDLATRFLPAPTGY